jgi:hypothetical protein
LGAQPTAVTVVPPDSDVRLTVQLKITSQSPKKRIAAVDTKKMISSFEEENK